MSKTISVPVSLLRKISLAANAFHELEDELEDFLLAHDPDFIAKMRQSRQEHLAGNTSSLEDLKQELCIK